MKTSNRNTLFDSIKGIAILAIMFIHLGQWNFELQEESRLAIIRSGGALGVELTFLINSFFLTKHYNDHSFEHRVSYLLKSLLNIIPVYWLGLTVYWVSSCFSMSGCKTDFINILSHYLFLNGLVPQWWWGFMGGTGYFGVLVIMWVIFPFFAKRVSNYKEAVFKGIIVISSAFIMLQTINAVNDITGFDELGMLRGLLWYLYRGIYCYVLGCILYYMLKIETKKTVISAKLKKATGYSMLAYIALMMIAYGNKFDGIWFTVLWGGGNITFI